MIYMGTARSNRLFDGVVSNYKSAEAATDKRLQRCVQWTLNELVQTDELDIPDVMATIAEERELNPDGMNAAYNLCLAEALKKDVTYGEA